jgi:hypothetical protein
MTSGLRLAVDLREYPATEEIERVSAAFSTSLAMDRAQRKLRTIGVPSERGTWVRIEARAVAHIDGQGWNGIECAATLRGVARPAWYQSLSWQSGDVVWRADETELVIGQPIRSAAAILMVDPGLSDTWWATLTSSLSALARHGTTRVATQTMRLVTQEHVSSVIHRAHPDVDTAIDEWNTAHGDLAWQNLTAPDCVILDWEDWGMAPRGYDAATLWHMSLAVPGLAERVYRELRADLDSRSGLLCQLMGCAMAARVPSGYEPITVPALAHADRILRQLSRF